MDRTGSPKDHGWQPVGSIADHLAEFTGFFRILLFWAYFLSLGRILLPFS